MNKNKVRNIKIVIIISVILIIIISFFVFIKGEKKDNTINKIENSAQYKENEKTEILIYDIEDGYLTVPYNKKAKKNNYNFKENLKIREGYYQYKDNNYESILGIDVSEYQGDIDWEEVKKSGVEFAILRLGYRGYGKEGKIILDKEFEQNYEEAKNQGIKLGVYFFSQALNLDEIREETEFILENIKDKDLDFPIVFDLEKIKNDDARTDNLTSDEINNMTLEFCKIIKDNGYIPAIYGNSKTFATVIKLELFDNIIKWYADYQYKPLYPYDFQIWQYTESGSISGITGDVDIDLCFKKGE